MAWKKASPELCELLEKAVQPFPYEKKMMFGCPAYFANGNMFTGVHGEGVIVRLAAVDRAEALSTYDEASVFEPMEGRPMKEYVLFPESVLGDEQLFRSWLERSLAFASSLPAKASKPKDSARKARRKQ